MKFHPDDLIQVKENGLKAKVIYTSFNAILQEWEYNIAWETASSLFKGTVHSYAASEVDDIWEKIGVDTSSGARTITLPEGNPYKDLLEQWNNTYRPKKECDHKWVEVSFAHSKMVCFHCNMEKP